jgi:hypothetical protein
MVPAMLSPPALTGVTPANSLDVIDVGGVDIRQRWVHVVGARGDQVHAINLNADAVVSQAANHRQAGNPAGAVAADTGQCVEQSCAIAGRCPVGCDARRAELAAVERRAAFDPCCRDHYFRHDRRGRVFLRHGDLPDAGQRQCCCDRIGDHFPVPLHYQHSLNDFLVRAF